MKHNKKKKPTIEIHHHYVTNDPREAFTMKKKYVSFHHEKYGFQTVRMTSKLWQIVLAGGLPALCREFDRLFDADSPLIRPGKGAFPSEEPNL